MVNAGNKLTKFLQEQIKREGEVASSMKEILNKVKNPVVKAVLTSISLDSIKHAELYRAAIHLTTVTTALTDEEFNQLKTITKKHVDMENATIKQLKDAVNKAKNKKVKFLLQSIAEDEDKHHKLLKMIMELIVREESITEEDLWKILWKNTPFHGTPGG